MTYNNPSLTNPNTANVFITGTDTDIGKTVVAAWLCMHSTAQYWKPVQTGDDSDSDVIHSFSPHTKIMPNAVLLKAPLSPFDAANLEDKTLDINEILRKAPKNTIIEGAGGVLVPITDNFSMAELAYSLGASALLVVQSKLGMINHTLLSIEALKNRNINILGIIINGSVESRIVDTIEKFSSIKVLNILKTHDNHDDLVKFLKQTKPSKLILEHLK